MRTFGRTCRGKGKVVIGVVRQTEKRLLETGRMVGALGMSAYLWTVRRRLPERLRQSLQS
jgi:hypothetical protein